MKISATFSSGLIAAYLLGGASASNERGENAARYRQLSEQRGYSKMARILHKASPETVRHLSSLPETDMARRRRLAEDGDIEAPQGPPGNVTYKAFDVSGLPREFDWRSVESYAKYGSVITGVKDQGVCGSCWAVSAVSALESAIAIKTGRLEELSPAMLVDCAPNKLHCGGSGGCDGSTAELAYDYLASVGGLMTEYEYSYEKDFWGIYNASIDDYEGIPFDDGKQCKTNLTSTVSANNTIAPVVGYKAFDPNNVTAVMEGIMEYGPLTASVDGSDWWNYTGGIFDCGKQAESYDNYVDLNHGVLLTGWGEEDGVKYWNVLNSWGSDFGEDGYIRLKRNDPERVPCHTDHTPLDGVACENIAPGVVAEHIPEQTVCGACGLLFDVVAPVLPDSLTRDN